MAPTPRLTRYVRRCCLLLFVIHTVGCTSSKWQVCEGGDFQYRLSKYNTKGDRVIVRRRGQDSLATWTLLDSTISIKHVRRSDSGNYTIYIRGISALPEFELIVLPVGDCPDRESLENEAVTLWNKATDTTTDLHQHGRGEALVGEPVVVLFKIFQSKPPTTCVMAIAYPDSSDTQIVSQHGLPDRDIYGSMELTLDEPGNYGFNITQQFAGEILIQRQVYLHVTGHDLPQGMPLLPSTCARLTPSVLMTSLLLSLIGGSQTI